MQRDTREYDVGEKLNPFSWLKRKKCWMCVQHKFFRLHSAIPCFSDHADSLIMHDCDIERQVCLADRRRRMTVVFSSVCRNIILH